MNRFMGVLCLFVLLLTGTSVRAQPLAPWVAGVSREQRQQANRIFQEGNALIRAGFFAGAAEKYEQALALWDHPGFRYNLAVTQINLDQPIEAYESLQRAVRFGAEPIGQDRYTRAQRYLTLLGNRLARIELACDEPGTIVTVDGKPAFTAPGRKTIVVRSGSHQVMASKQTHLPDTRQIVLVPGQLLAVTLTPQVPTYIVTSRRWPRSGPLTIASIGLAGLAGGAVLDWQSSSMFHDFERDAGECPPDGCVGSDARRLRDQRGQAIRVQRMARITYAAGAAFFATGAVLSYLNESRPVRRRVVLETPPVSILPVLTPDTAGVSAHFEF